MTSFSDLFLDFTDKQPVTNSKSIYLTTYLLARNSAHFSSMTAICSCLSSDVNQKQQNLTAVIYRVLNFVSLGSLITVIFINLFSSQNNYPICTKFQFKFPKLIDIHDFSSLVETTLLLQGQQGLLIVDCSTPCQAHNNNFTSLINPSMGRGVNWLHFAIQVQPTFLISDIRALWRSTMSAREPGCQKLKM